MIDDLNATVEGYHDALDAFGRGASEPIKSLYSHRDDVTLANPFGPPVLGWDKVSEALNFASARFRDGGVSRFESIASHQAAELACIVEMEHWRAKVSGRDVVAPWDLRVTTLFRREDDDWKVIHRHADPIATPHPDGPLRAS